MTRTHRSPVRPANPVRALALMAAALVLASLVGCSVDRRSGAYRCDGQGNCTGGRVCEQGWCVVPSGGLPDALPPDDCPDVCQACEAGTCILVCDQMRDCLEQVRCPPGMDCEVACLGNQRCAGGVDCSQADDCAVTCDGVGACAAGVTCGTGQCDVDCSGLGSCAQGIDCSASCACDTECDSEVGCGLVSCPGEGGSCEQSGECDSSDCNFC